MNAVLTKVDLRLLALPPPLGNIHRPYHPHPSLQRHALTLSPLPHPHKKCLGQITPPFIPGECLNVFTPSPTSKGYLGSSSLPSPRGMPRSYHPLPTPENSYALPPPTPPRAMSPPPPPGEFVDLMDVIRSEIIRQTDDIIRSSFHACSRSLNLKMRGSERTERGEKAGEE